MSDRLWTAALVYPAPLYVGLLVLGHFGWGDVAFSLGFFLALGFGSVTGFGLLRRPSWVWVGRLFFVLAGVAPIGYGYPLSGYLFDLACGITLGAPFLWLEYAWHDRSSPATKVIALEAALFFGVLGLATLSVVPSSPGGSAGRQFLNALAHVIAGQLQGLAAVLSGGTATSMPLESTLDVVFVCLGGLALAGVVLSWISPRTALEESLPWSWVGTRASPKPSVPISEELGLRPGQRAALATRTLPTPPSAAWPPGLGSVVVASLLVVGFVSLTVVAPTVALLSLVIGAAVALVAVALVLSRQLTRLGGLSAEPAGYDTATGPNRAEEGGTTRPNLQR